MANLPHGYWIVEQFQSWVGGWGWGWGWGNWQRRTPRNGWNNGETLPNRLKNVLTADVRRRHVLKWPMAGSDGVNLLISWRLTLINAVKSWQPITLPLLALFWAKSANWRRHFCERRQFSIKLRFFSGHNLFGGIHTDRLPPPSTLDQWKIFGWTESPWNRKRIILSRSKNHRQDAQIETCALD